MLVEVVELVNARQMSAEAINDPISTPFSQAQILFMKADYMLPLSGDFTRPQVYHRRQWRRNLTNGDIVLLLNETSSGQWPISRTTHTQLDKNNSLRKMTFRVYEDNTLGSFVKPVHKYVFLLPLKEQS